LLLGAGRSAVAAPERVAVLLLERSVSEGRLRDALRIQLPREVELETAPLAPTASVADRIRQGRDQLAHRRGLLALWIEQDTVVGSEREITVYFVGRRGDRALVEVVRVRAGAGEQLERAVALKALEVLEALRQRPDEGVIAPFAGSTVAPVRETRTQPPGYRLSFVAELGGAGATPAGSAPGQLAGQVGAGASLRAPGWRIEALGNARVPAPFEVSEAAGELRATELDLWLSVRALWESERFALGGFGSVGGRMVSVEGSTAAGSRGSSDRIVPVLALGPEVRLVFVPWLALRGAAGPEIALRRQSFTLNREPVVDLGRGRGVLEIGVIATLP
jgi:hypothetical protein